MPKSATHRTPGPNWHGDVKDAQLDPSGKMPVVSLCGTPNAPLKLRRFIPVKAIASLTGVSRRNPGQPEAQPKNQEAVDSLPPVP